MDKIGHGEGVKKFPVYPSHKSLFLHFYKKGFRYENIKKIPIGMFFDLHAKLEIDTVKFEITIAIFTH